MPDTEPRYEVREVIASGGMATVWRAYDRRLDREVALKRPHPAPPGDPVLTRFEREARAAAALGHPHLVTVFDSGVDDEGPFLVMELVEGPTLAEASPDPMAAMRIGADLAEALAAVHGAGMVHRDVKPHNVLMSARGPLLTDFGIARSEGDTRRLTEPGAGYATPSYAAPEVLAGADPTAASDVYSLALVVYEAATGHAPDGEVATGHPALDAVLVPALSSDPAQRPAASGFAAGLRSAPATRPLDTPAAAPPATAPATAPTTATAPVEPPPRREMRPVLVAIVALLALAAAVRLLPDAGRDEAGAGVPGSTEPSVTSTTSPPTSATTAAPPTTSPDTTESDPVSAAYSRFEEALTAVHPSTLKPKEQREILKKVDEAIEKWDHDDDSEAVKKLEEAAKKIDDHLEGAEEDHVMEALTELADAMGLVD